MPARSEALFSPQWLRGVLSRLPATHLYRVAYSGGPDSHALLHALAALRDDLHDAAIHAVHVNHGLMSAARNWEVFCAGVCHNLNVPYRVVQARVSEERGVSIEAAARTARYEALAGVMEPGDIVLTAHTQDDQAETLLLQLLRGSGSDGLAAMPEYVAFAGGWLARPLLQMSRSAVHGFSSSLPAEPIEDPSNQDRRLARNYLRHEVLPSIKRRWPSAGVTLARAATHQAQASQLTKELANIDLEGARDSKTNTLCLPVLLSLSPLRRRNTIRGWIRSCGVPLPSTAQLERMEKDVLGSSPGRAPMVVFGDMCVRRYGDVLYLIARGETSRQAAILSWDLVTPLDLAGGRLSAKRKAGEGITTRRIPGDGVTVQFRRGGERCRPAGRAHHQTLKHLFQEFRIPPWERSHIPLIYIENELAVVSGLCVCEGFVAHQEETGWVIEWQPAQAPGSGY